MRERINILNKSIDYVYTEYEKMYINNKVDEKELKHLQDIENVILVEYAEIKKEPSIENIDELLKNFVT